MFCNEVCVREGNRIERVGTAGAPNRYLKFTILNLIMIIKETNLPLPLLKRGKVRDIYNLKDELLIVSTDRISAFDWVLPDAIPYKGIVLTQISKYWFDSINRPNHMISTDTKDFPKEARRYNDVLEGRSMLVKKTEPFPVECIVRGYISGSAWKSYKNTGKVCGIELPEGLAESEKLSEPIFTPSTKAEEGHDINITFDEMEKIVGNVTAKYLKCASLNIYRKAGKDAEEKGIIVADTKFEFGLDENGRILVIDELLTPDSSRFWPADKYKPGTSQPSFDKQYVRDFLSIGWNKNSPPPGLPEKIVRKTKEKYIEAYKRITGKEFDFQYPK